ncbi:hypothetical protein ACWCPQ_34725 [Nocardia sp. NPDC001965]
MNKARIEAHVVDLVNQVCTGGKIEDAYVEAKSEWPDVNKARQLAAMANAAGGQPITWIIGLNEDDHSVEALDATDPADWWPQMEKRFVDGIAPTMTDLRVNTEHGWVYSLTFETDRAPYLVTTGGKGPAESEAPWREGTRTRTAKRHELLSLLRAQVSVPELELVNAHARIMSMLSAAVPQYRLWFETQLFINSEPGQNITFPAHHWSATFTTDKGFFIPTGTLRFRTENDPVRQKTDHRVFATPPQPAPISPYGATKRDAGLFVLSPDVVTLNIGFEVLQTLADPRLTESQWLEVEIRLPLNGSARVAQIRHRMPVFDLAESTDTSDLVRKWQEFGFDMS